VQLKNIALSYKEGRIMTKENKILVDRTRLSNIMAVAYVLNRSFCANPDRYLKLEEIMKEVSEHLTIDLNQPNDILIKMDSKKRQFRRYIDAVSASIRPVESAIGKNGGYRLTKNIQGLPLFTEEECTMLSLTLPKSDLVAQLKKKPTIEKRLNLELVKAGYTVSSDVLYGLMDAVDAIQRHQMIKLNHYHYGGDKNKNPEVSPVSIRWFKGAYYVVCVNQDKKDGRIFFTDYRFERAESREFLNKEITISFKESDLEAYVDNNVFGLHRGKPNELKKYKITVDNYYANRVEESLDHKVKLIEKDELKTTYEVFAYGDGEIKSYLHYLLYLNGKGAPKAHILEEKS
jgi:hypothetical protein